MTTRIRENGYTLEFATKAGCTRRGNLLRGEVDETFYRKLEGTGDLVTFEATGVSGLKNSFRESVDDYLATCKGKGKEPDKPFKGTRCVAVFAASNNETLNAFATTVLERYLHSRESLEVCQIVSINRSASCDAGSRR